MKSFEYFQLSCDMATVIYLSKFYLATVQCTVYTEPSTWVGSITEPIVCYKINTDEQLSKTKYLYHRQLYWNLLDFGMHVQSTDNESNNISCFRFIIIYTQTNSTTYFFFTNRHRNTISIQIDLCCLFIRFLYFIRLLVRSLSFSAAFVLHPLVIKLSAFSL